MIISFKSFLHYYCRSPGFMVWFIHNVTIWKAGNAMPEKSSSAAVIPSDLKLNNRIQVLNVFKCGREYTANEVAGKIGLSRQTVMKAIQFFVDKGLLTPAGKGASTNVGGKKPVLFSLSSDKYLLCIEIWPEELNFILLDFRGAVIDRFTLKQPLLADVGRTMETVGGMAGQLLEQNLIGSVLFL